MLTVIRLAFTALLVLVPSLAPSAAWAKDAALPNTFAEKGFGYTLRYPQGWTLTRPGGYVVVIGGAGNSPQSTSVVSIDNRLSPHPGEPVRGANAVFEQYLAEVKANAPQSTVERQSPFHQKGQNAQKQDRGPVGFQAVVQFNGDSTRLSQWAVVLPRKSGTIVHVWTFTAPLETFEQSLPSARAILDSWLLLPDEKPPAPPEQKKPRSGRPHPARE